MINSSFLNFLFEVKYHLTYLNIYMKNTESRNGSDHGENFIDTYLEDILQCFMTNDIV